MKKTDFRYNTYVKILEEELVPAMGCTEPIAIAYAAAKARDTLGALPERIICEVSGNIIKNVKSVVVPHTAGLRGIGSAAAIGAFAGDAGGELEVLSLVSEEQTFALKEYIDSIEIEIFHKETDHAFDITVSVFKNDDSASVRLAGRHTNIVSIEKNGQKLFESPVIEEEKKTNREVLTVEGIVDFADSVDVSDVCDVINRQIDYNMAIAMEGLKNDYGANIGKVLLHGKENVMHRKMRAYAAAGSDARMNGCELPVVINSGSGNQGITASVPVIVFANHMGYSREKLIRALCVSNLVTTHLKTGIGCLSAYCGVVSAGAAAASGVAYLMGGGLNTVAHTIVNTLAMDSGIICDGAKASCAAKISSAIDAGMLGLNMYLQGNQFYGGDGIVTKGVEATIANVGRIAREGMCGTDREIIKLMMEN